MNAIGFNPNVAAAAPKVSFGNATRIMGQRPDIRQTINTFKDSKLGQFIIDKAGKAIKFVAEKLGQNEGIKKVVDIAKNVFEKANVGSILKKGIEFVKNNYTKIVDNPIVQKVATVVKNIITKAPKTV